jgi:hypothetical protein
MSLGNDFSDGIALLFGFACGLWWVTKGVVLLGNQIKTYTDERNQRVTKA